VLRPEVLRRRLTKLEEYLAILDHLSGYGLDDFLADPERYGSAERFLQLAIEALSDMGSHLVAERNLGLVQRNRDLPRLLREHGFIDPALEGRWVRMIGFRNVLVHDYLEIDRRIVHRVLQEDLGDIRALTAVFAGLS
jgi:uncharacterized protein YutE (UPF0331/DUF86 family)